MPLVVEHLHKSFGRFPALNDVSLQAADGEFLALLGPSGSGKTTLLRVLAGLEFPDSGAVTVDGRDHLALSARERRVGMVFQHYALFRHMTVAQNIAFGLTVRPGRDRPPRAEVDRRVTELLDLVRLTGLEKRRPAQLSGGQRQRVALARALCVEPRLLLLDEPFGALDAKVRAELRTQLRRVHDATHVTTVFVTHDQEEAMGIADRVAVLSAGKIEQVGAPAELEQSPASAFVFEFLGETNRLPCTVRDDVADLGHGVRLPTLPGGRKEGDGTALFRPYDVDLRLEGEGIPVRIEALHRRGLVCAVECRGPAGEALQAEVAAATCDRLAPGAEARLAPTRVFAS